MWVLLTAALKDCCHIWNQCSQIFQNATFHAKLKHLKFRAKNIFGIFGEIWRKLLSCLKQILIIIIIVIIIIIFVLIIIIIIVIVCLTPCSGCCYCSHFFWEASHTKSPKANRMIFSFKISNTSLNILAVPNNAVFCIPPELFFIPSFSICPLSSLVTLPRAPITTGTTYNILSFHNLLISLSLSLSLSLSTFPLCPFPIPLHLHQLVRQYWWLSSFALSCQLRWCLIFLPLPRCHNEHWYPRTLSLVQTSQWPFFATLPCCFLYYSEPISHIYLLSVAHFHLFFYIICTGGFHWFYWCSDLHSLSW